MEKICRLCNSPNLELREKYELFNPETDESELVSGLLCLNCNCFHGVEMDWFQYDVVEDNWKTKFIEYNNGEQPRILG